MNVHVEVRMQFRIASECRQYNMQLEHMKRVQSMKEKKLRCVQCYQQIK